MKMAKASQADLDAAIAKLDRAQAEIRALEDKLREDAA